MDENEATKLIQDAREKLELGFYIKNLDDLAKIFQKMSVTTKWATACFVLSEIAFDIARSWDDRPLPTSEAVAVDKEMRPLIINVLDAMEKDVSIEVLSTALDQVVLKVQSLDI
jgi:hypothetical protein